MSNCIACGDDHQIILKEKLVCADCVDQIMDAARDDPTIVAIQKRHAEICQQMRERMKEISKAWAAKSGVAFVDFMPPYDSCSGYGPTECEPLFRTLNVVEKLARESGSE